MRWIAPGALAALVVVGCSTVVPEDSGFTEVQRLSADRIHQRIHWRRGSAEDAEADAEVRQLLAAPLSADSAVQIALLENRTIQEAYERLGVAQADLVQAGLLRNPVFFGSVRFPDGGPSGTNVEIGVVQDFLDVLLRSARKSIAEAQFEETRLSVAGEVVDFAARVRSAYYAALGAQQVVAVRQLVVDAGQASAELAQRLHDAGNISDLQLASELGMYESARVALARAEAERLEAREDLTRQMGLWGPDVAWAMPESLPEIPPAELRLEDLEAEAVERRLDLAAACKEADLLAHALGVTRDWRFLAVADVGVSAERDVDGQWVTGPELALELPVFDRREPEIARKTSELRRADHRVWALAVEIRSEVRAARDRLLAQRRLVEHYRQVVIPVRESTVALTQEEFNYMLVGAFELIVAKQAEYDAYQEYVEAVRDYWISRVALERAVGGVLTSRAGIDVVDPGGESTRSEPEHHDGHESHGRN